MKYRRPLLKTLAILGPMMLALSSGATKPAHAQDWCSGAYDNTNCYYDPRCAYDYYGHPYTCAYPDPYPFGSFFFFDDDHHRFRHHFDNHFPGRDPGFHHGGLPHRGDFPHGGDVTHDGGGFAHGGGGFPRGGDVTHGGGFAHGGGGFAHGGGFTHGGGFAHGGSGGGMMFMRGGGGHR